MNTEFSSIRTRPYSLVIDFIVRLDFEMAAGLVGRSALSEADIESLCVYPLPKSLEITCPVCFVLLYEDPHVNVACGHHLCGSCVAKVHQCPECRHTLQTVPDRGLQRIINALQIYCSKKEEGCRWEGDLGDLKVHHRNDCAYVNIRCSSCNNHVQRCQLEIHQLEDCPSRPATCEHCGLQCKWQELNEIHYRECPSYCSMCNKTIPKGDIGGHKTNLCPKVNVICEASEFGCTWEGLREEREKHTRDNWIGHLHMWSQYFIEGRVEQCTEKISSVEVDLKEYKKEASQNVELVVSKCKDQLCIKIEHAKKRADNLKDKIKELKDEISERDAEIASMHETIEEMMYKCKEALKIMKSEIKEQDTVIASLQQKVHSFQDFVRNHLTQKLSILLEDVMNAKLKDLEDRLREEFASQGPPPAAATLHDWNSSDKTLVATETNDQAIERHKITDHEESNSCVNNNNGGKASSEFGGEGQKLTEESSSCVVDSVKEGEASIEHGGEEGHNVTELTEESVEGGNVGGNDATTDPDDSIISKELEIPPDASKPIFIYNLELQPIKWKFSNKSHLSTPFYVGFYRMCLRVHPNGRGSGNGQYVSVYICLVKGKYDRLAQWPFYGEITVKLQHRGDGEPLSKKIRYVQKTPESFCVVDKEEGISKGNGHPKFVSHMDVDKYMTCSKLVFHVYAKLTEPKPVGKLAKKQARKNLKK